MLIDLLRSRRSIRQFSDRAVEPGKIELLVETVLRSPSSRSLNPWEFIVVTDPDLIARLAKAKPHGARFMEQATLVLVVCADPEKCDVWIEDASIATLLAHLCAADLGLGSCWVQIRKRMHNEQVSAEAYTRTVLNIPDHIAVEAFVALGYPAEQKAGHARESLLTERISYETFRGKRKR